MDILVLVGWDEEVAIPVLVSLNTLPAIEEPEDSDQDPMEKIREYVCSDIGISHINDRLEQLNLSRDITLKWAKYSGDHFVLVWKTELQKSIGDPTEPPTQKFYLGPTASSKLENLKKEFDIKEDPYMILISDASEYYHYHIYDDPDAQEKWSDED